MRACAGASASASACAATRSGVGGPIYQVVVGEVELGDVAGARGVAQQVHHALHRLQAQHAVVQAQPLHNAETRSKTRY